MLTVMLVYFLLAKTWTWTFNSSTTFTPYYQPVELPNPPYYQLPLIN